MEGDDWTNCWGEVFHIYRMNGPGSVTVGDVIGLFYPREGNWFSMAGGVGHKNPCPGSPTNASGFENEDNWFHCWGEVFRIYARGKSIGQIITDHDHITLFFIQSKTKWVGLVDELDADLRTCPGTVRPPPDENYDICWGEIFELWSQL